MAYVSLYRRYRPQTFDDVVGQTHVTRTLMGAIAEGRLHHAYLFTGPRGTGKTSTARILAKAINCEEGPTPTPCNACRQCHEITEGTSVDVIELDMASHGGVDDARELRERALFAPASARRKVYILDEVHMASTAAFNALLKLIEEPPDHVMFAMATTDPQKVLPTIMSRVQRLDLRRVSAGDVAASVRHICEAEGYGIEDGAVEAIVRAGDGSLRDTQSVLEQVLAYTGAEVTADAVRQVLGQTPTERVVEVVDLVAARDVAGLLAAVQQLVDDGHDLRRFTLDLVQHVRDLLVLGAAPDHPDLVDATEERRQLLLQQSTALPSDTLLRAVRVLAETVAEQRVGSPRLPLELALASLVVPSEQAQLDELTDRLARLEAGGLPRATGGPVAAGEDAGPPVPDPVPVPDPDPAPGPIPDPEPQPVPDPGPAPIPEPDPSPVPDPEPQPEPVPMRDPAGEPAEASGPESAAADASDLAGEPAEASGPESAAAVAPDLAREAGPDAEPTVDAAPTQDAEPAVDAAPAEDELAAIQQRWEAILDVIREGSRRHHAVFLPATPVRAGRGILTLRYGRRYASFHAANAGTGEYAAAMQQAIERTCGLRMRLDIVVEGEDDRRRPQPPSVTPDDARTPVDHDGAATDAAPSTAATSPSRNLARVTDTAQGSSDPGGGSDEEIDVREAELDAPTEADPQTVGRLLADELGAELVDERPASGDR